MIINIHWGEFCGAAERTESYFPQTASHTEPQNSVYKYCMLLRGYLPFTLFKNHTTKQWITDPLIDPSISKMVIFYTEKLIDEFELKSQL